MPSADPAGGDGRWHRYTGAGSRGDQAGGLGMLSSTFPMPVDEQLSWVQQRTERPVGVGFFAFELPARTGELELAARRARVVDVFWGDPDATVVERIHAGGAIAFWQVGSLDEAVAAVDAGCDAVIAQGIEAGGHVRGTTPLATLLRQVIAALEVPVIAAGGVAIGAALAEALNAGASAARVGTRFLATAESGAHPDYVTALLAATADATVHTTAFGEDWPDAPIACCVSLGSARLHARTGSSPAPPTGTRTGRSSAGPLSHRRYSPPARWLPWPCTPAAACATSPTCRPPRRSLSE
jgi:nitronate monooxygenase